MAGLIIYSAALNAVAARRPLEPHPSCRRTNGDPCPISPNEVRQLMATGQVNGQTQVDDVDFSPDPELSCPAPGCTDPYAALRRCSPRAPDLLPARHQPRATRPAAATTSSTATAA